MSIKDIFVKETGQFSKKLPTDSVYSMLYHLVNQDIPILISEWEETSDKIHILDSAGVRRIIKENYTGSSSLCFDF